MLEVVSTTTFTSKFKFIKGRHSNLIVMYSFIWYSFCYFLILLREKKIDKISYYKRIGEILNVIYIAFKKLHSNHSFNRNPLQNG